MPPFLPSGLSAPGARFFSGEPACNSQAALGSVCRFPLPLSIPRLRQPPRARVYDDVLWILRRWERHPLRGQGLLSNGERCAIRQMGSPSGSPRGRSPQMSRINRRTMFAVAALMGLVFTAGTGGAAAQSDTEVVVLDRDLVRLNTS